MYDHKNRYRIQEYHKKPTFASFLPGLSGVHGIPVWCFYVNRGQCITSFGLEDKDHALMEFYPAHQAYQRTKRMGFRTFLKVNGIYTEAFAGDVYKKEMLIGMNDLIIREENTAQQLEITVKYYTLPSEELGGLVRQVSICNKGSQKVSIEALDGMAEMLPYGIDWMSMKVEGQTSKAWMEVLNHETGIPYCKMRVSTDDIAEVKEVEGGNFGFAFGFRGEVLPAVINQENVFGYDNALENPLNFQKSTLSELMAKEQIAQNILPCCFFALQQEILPGETCSFVEVFGQTKNQKSLNRLYQKAAQPDFFSEKEAEAYEITRDITERIATKTASQNFDNYCRQTYLDNVLRGGCPTVLGGSKLFYLYSRKHGDVERDYNFFRMLPEFYTQGNGNFRDVNQNRRSDVQFYPFVGDANIKMFYNCIQIDGYNPLGIEKTTYHMPGEEKSFTPGQLYQELLEAYPGKQSEVEEIFQQKMSLAKGDDKTNYMEGYWSDHWTYNLDLVESYLTIYPEKEESLLFEDDTYLYKQAAVVLLPRTKRYVHTKQGIRQYNYLKKNPEGDKREYLEDRNGRKVTSTLAEELFLICVVKTAALDFNGMGIEMEGGKPGWYDALNGLPGLLGSSMCETYEVARNLSFLLSAMEKYRKTLLVPQELMTLAVKIVHAQDAAHMLDRWNLVNDAKEQFWEAACGCLSGVKAEISSEEAIRMLNVFQTVVMKGIEKALEMGGGISPAYFSYEVLAYEEDREGILPTKVKAKMLPCFLEGPVRFLKLDVNQERKHSLYQQVKASGLYDSALGMYKVNASLAQESYEIGRARAFTPGWLENESIWLHMEYKYLLELLKSGLYEAFIEDFKSAAIPFQKEERYGRSILENSSFIASSANPDPKLHGRGFVARLSGSTAEFVQMWQIMMFGARPFTVRDGILTLSLRPLLPAYLIDRQKEVQATFLGSIPVVYYLSDQNDYIPDNYTIKEYIITKKNGEITRELGEKLQGDIVKEIRDEGVIRIEVYLQAKAI